MRALVITLLAGAASMSSSAALAADALKFGPAPAWVRPHAIPPVKSTPAPVALLLDDSQVAFDHGKITTYSDGALKIQNAQGLGAGNLAIVWQPATDTVTVNKFVIRRGDKIIDVLASGQTFTVLRRETNLDAATLDGTLTATIQPEGLQEGDIIELATTTERSDPVLKGHVEALFAAWGGLPVQTAHATLNWPTELRINVRQTPNLPAAHRSSAGGRNILELSAEDVQPLVPPKGAPERFQIGRLAEATDFASWADLANLFAPLFKDAAAIPPSGPLYDEVEKIRTSTTDPRARATQALALVQDRVRYVALLMGQGSYVPASAEQTWSRRFGDCKAKTALLLAILQSLGINAEPVVVQTKLGDMVAERLPMIGLFNHVLVRAHIGGRDYWLDGTRTGDSDLEAIQTPDFGWGLPLVEHAELVHMVPSPLNSANVEHAVDMDASGGIYAPAPTTIKEVYRGDTAVQLNTVYSAVTAEQRDEALRDKAKGYFDGYSVTSSSVEFDKSKRQLVITIKGTAKLGWKDGWFYVPTSSIGFDPDFERPAGTFHDAAVAVNHPTYIKDRATIRLPAGFAAQQKLSPSVRETLAGVEYVRSETVQGDVLTVESSERSIAPEVAYKDATAAEPRLRALDKDDVYLRVADSYTTSDKDLASLAASTPSSASEFLLRGSTYLDRAKFDEAIRDFSKALELDPASEWALADRALAYAWKEDFPAAEKDIAAAQKIDAGNSVAIRAQGLLAQQKGDCKNAIVYFSKVLDGNSSDNFSLGHRALCERDLKDDQALADSEAALKAAPSWMDLRVLRANILYKRGDRAAVEREAELITRENPASDYAYVAAGKIYDRLDRHENAMKAFDKALSIKPWAYIYVNRAAVRPASDRQGRLADLDAALKLEPRNVDALYAKAELLQSSGDMDGAIKLYEEASKQSQHATGLEVRRAALLYKIGRKDEAQKILAVRRSEAKTASEFNNLCWEKATSGILLESALQDCQEGLKLNPDSGPILDSTGFVLLRLGKLDDAIAEYGKAIAKNTGSASFMGRAIAYARKGDKAHAEADRAEALKLDRDAETRFKDYGVPYPI